MFYKKFSPAPALKPYVYGYYMLEHRHYLPTPMELHSPPSGAAGMVFHYGDAGWVVHESGESLLTPSCFLAGQFKKKLYPSPAGVGRDDRCGILAGGSAPLVRYSYD